MDTTFEFSGPNGEFQFGLADWHFAVELAEDHGWKPAGTVFSEPPPEDKFYGSTEDPEEIARAERESEFLRDYFSNSGQWVTQEDAKNMAAAIEKSLDDIPNHDVIEHKERRSALPRRVAEWCRIMPGPRPTPGIREAISAVEWFSGKEKSRLKAFVEYCRAGGFYFNDNRSR